MKYTRKLAPTIAITIIAVNAIPFFVAFRFRGLGTSLFPTLFKFSFN